MSQHPVSIRRGTFSLDISGVAGFFGGDEAVQAMKTIHLYKARRWTGWYNVPGSFAIAKCLGPIANSRFWNGLFPGPNQDPDTVFGLDNHSGPKYIASQSGTVINSTTHVAYLVTQQSKEASLPVITLEGRVTRPMTVTVFEVMGVQSSAKAESKEPPTVTVNVLDHNKWWAGIPISTTLIACVLCAYNRDWYCLAMILLGTLSNGLTCLIVGLASVVLKGVKPADKAPPGDGMLMDDNSNHIVILRGKEKDVNWVTKGRLRLEYLPKPWMKKKRPNDTSYPDSETGSSSATPVGANPDEEKSLGQERPKETHGPEEHRNIGLCALLLGTQSLLQLLLIPQGTLFGQIMFLSSFIISWAYNLYLSSLDKEKVQRQLLLQTLTCQPHTSRFVLGTRTSAAVFAALVLRPPSKASIATREKAPIKLLKCFLPNETEVWGKWREHVGEHIKNTNWSRDTTRSEVDECKRLLKAYRGCVEGHSNSKDAELLKDLLNDASDAFEGYYRFLGDKNSQEKPSDDQGVGGGEEASSFGCLSRLQRPALTLTGSQPGYAPLQE